MIILISSRDDVSTNDVIDWLITAGRQYVRISLESRLSIDSIGIRDGEVDCLFSYYDIEGKKCSLNTNQITGYWYRRSALNYQKRKSGNALSESKRINSGIADFIYSDQVSLYQFLHKILYKKRGIGRIEHNQTNKLYNLTIAQSCGLNVPNSLYSNNRETFMRAVTATDEKEYITKSLGDSWVSIGSLRSIGMTSSVTMSDIREKEYAYAFIQERIDKCFELRIFYLDGVCYTSAILSQRNDKTEVDFRNYDEELPNRVVPYELPVTIECQIKSFMEKVGITSGSIDMIYSNSGEYIFLEVNPIGQFAQVSYPCNYNLEQKISKYLYERAIT